MLRKTELLFASLFLGMILLISIGCSNSKDTSPNDSLNNSPGTVTDIDGNSYITKKIGNQVWMVENLRVTHYNNGDPIPNVADNATWIGLVTGAYCEYNNDNNFVDTYGRLYNWYAVNDSRKIAPDGWHVPTDADWKELEMFLGMSKDQADAEGYRITDNEGGKIKENGTAHWVDPNTGATNSSGFTALPGGYRFDDGNFYDITTHAYFWTTTESVNETAWNRRLINSDEGIYRNPYFKHNGKSVRCVKD